MFGEDDLEAAETGRGVRDAGFGEELILETNRVLGRGMARYAEALRTLSAAAILEPGADEHELAHRFAAGRRGAAAAHPRVDAARVHDALPPDAAQRGGDAAGVHAGGAEARPHTIAFADLVGFTELGETVASEELGDVAARLSRLAGDVVEAPVRLVKTIGDAVMLVAPEPKEMVGRDAGRWSSAPTPPRTSRRCGRASRTARRSTSGATGTARRSTSPAG